MAATEFQREICRLIAKSRRESGESYVAGGVALNTLLRAPRISRDIDLFHDTDEALRASWDNDRTLLTRGGYALDVVRQTAAYVEAVVAKGGDRVVMQWLRDSAFRFFPLIEDDAFGLVLHLFDLATNKVLALVGRLEPRDWIDVLTAHDRLQPLGFLAWAACGKDPGFSPASLLAEAARGGRYTQAELDELAFEGPVPDAGALGAKWHRVLAEARSLVESLPAEHVGKAVLDNRSQFYRGDSKCLRTDLQAGAVIFHAGRIRGVWPALATKPASSDGTS